MTWTTKICACAIGALSLAASPSFADGQHSYFVIDNAHGYTWVGREQEAIENATEMLRVAQRFSRRTFPGMQVSVFGTSESAEHLAGSPAEILKATKPVESVEAFKSFAASEKVCGDFEELFTTLEYRLLRDDPEAAFIVMSSPMIDFEFSYCGSDANGALSIPKAPKPEYLLEKILTNPALKAFVVVGADPKQEQAWFRYIAKIEGAVRPTFVKKEGIRSSLVEAAK